MEKENVIFITILIIAIGFFCGVLVYVAASPRVIIGEVTAIEITTRINGQQVEVYIKTLNGDDSALSIKYYGSGDEVKVGHVYRISVGWWNNLESVEELQS